MSMDPELQNVEQLRRLLALKRHEQPPPGYWENFSSKVVARIEAGEQGTPDSFAERLLHQFSFLQRFWAALESRPALAGAFGAAMCGLLIAGVLHSEDASPAAAITSVVNPLVSGGANFSQQLAAASQPTQLSSTNPPPPFDPGELFRKAEPPLQLVPANNPWITVPQGN